MRAAGVALLLLLACSAVATFAGEDSYEEKYEDKYDDKYDSDEYGYEKHEKHHREKPTHELKHLHRVDHEYGDWDEEAEHHK